MYLSARRRGRQLPFVSIRMNRWMARVRTCRRAGIGRQLPRGSAWAQHESMRHSHCQGRQPIARGARAMKGMAGIRTSRIAGEAIGLLVSLLTDRRRGKKQHRVFMGPPPCGGFGVVENKIALSKQCDVTPPPLGAP